MPENRKPVPGSSGEDLSQRLEKYRARLAAEGRTKSLAVVDQALAQAPSATRRAKLR